MLLNYSHSSRFLIRSTNGTEDAPVVIRFGPHWCNAIMDVGTKNPVRLPFLIWLEQSIESNHKPLVPLLNSKQLNHLPTSVVPVHRTILLVLAIVILVPVLEQKLELEL